MFSTSLQRLGPTFSQRFKDVICPLGDTIVMIGNSKTIFSSKFTAYEGPKHATVSQKIITPNVKKKINSRWWCPNTNGVDAFKQFWGDDNNWLFPPPRL